MKWDRVALANLVVTTLVALVGWFVIDRLGSVRERELDRRNMVTAFLIETYGAIETVAQRADPTAEQTAAFERAFADLQLFGTEDQVLLGRDLASEIVRQGGADPEALLRLLRADLRSALGLPLFNDDDIYFVRFPGPTGDATVSGAILEP